MSRAGSTNSPRPRLRSLSHPNSRAPGLPRPALRPCWPRLPALQSGPGRRRTGEGGDGSLWAEAAEDSRAPDGLSSLARAAWGCEGPPELQGLREGDGGGAASAPGCGGTGGEGSEPAVAACLPWGAGSSALAPASRSPSGLPGPTKNMTEAPAPPLRADAQPADTSALPLQPPLPARGGLIPPTGKPAPPLGHHPPGTAKAGTPIDGGRERIVVRICVHNRMLRAGGSEVQLASGHRARQSFCSCQ